MKAMDAPYPDVRPKNKGGDNQVPVTLGKNKGNDESLNITDCAEVARTRQFKCVYLGGL